MSNVLQNPDQPGNTNHELADRIAYRHETPNIEEILAYHEEPEEHTTRSLGLGALEAHDHGQRILGLEQLWQLPE